MPHKQTRADKFTAYLVGDGLLSRLPKSDTEFFQLAGKHAGSSWRINAGHGQIGAADAQSPTCDTTQETTLCTAKSESLGEQVDSDQQLYRPKKNLPYPIFQETYTKWKGAMDINLGIRRVRRKKTLYIQPLDELPELFSDFKYILNGQPVGFFDLLEEFSRKFFTGFDARTLDPVSVDRWKVTRRIHKITGEPQLLAADLNRGLAKLLSNDALAVIGVSWVDLYPSEQLNFVLGETSAVLHTASVSFGRFETKLFEKFGRPNELTEVDGLLIWKIMKVLAHETCHTFFMSHCVFFECLMNESSSVVEAMSQPLFLCPVCLRKLQKVCRFRIKPWHEGLLAFLEPLLAQYPCEHLANAVSWLRVCIDLICD